jgi:hypothetical protein
MFNETPTKADLVALADGMEAVAANRESVLQLADDNLRIRLVEAGRKLRNAMENSHDTTYRIMSTVSPQR